MGIVEKYVLYEMLYERIFITRLRRGGTLIPLKAHYQAIKTANYILAAIGESVTEEELKESVLKGE